MFLAAIFITLVFLLHAAWPEQCNRWFERWYLGLLLALVGALCGALFIFARYENFNMDEILHIHCAWYVAKGFRPAADFFTKNHPLLYYAVQPLLGLFDDTTTTIIALRMLEYVQAICVVAMVYLIATKVAPAREVRLLSLVALLSQSIFLRKIVEFRPDVPMTLCVLAAVYFLLDSLQTGKRRHFIACGLSTAIALLFCQKGLYLLAALALVLGWRTVQRKMTFASLAWFGVSFALPVLLFLGVVAASGMFHDYLVNDWLVYLENDYPQRSWQPLLSLVVEHRLLPRCAAIMLLAIVAPAVMLTRRDSAVETKVVAFVGLFILLAILVSIKVPFAHYFLPSVCLFSIAIAQFLTLCFERVAWRPLFRLALVGIVLVLPMAIFEQSEFVSNREMLDKIEYVLQNTTESDPVYDGHGIYNVFRPDLHYVWYHVERHSLPIWLNQVRRKKFEDYDIYRLIEEKRPKFISGWDLDINTPGLREKYQEVKQHPYKSPLYIRRDP